MKTLTRLFASCTVALTASVSAFADNAGTTGANLLSIPVSARAIGMGEAFTAMADNTASLYWNPAGIALLNQSEASFMYSQWLKDMTFQNAAIATPLEHGGLGGSVSYLSYGHIDGFDASGNPAGNVNAYSAVGTLGGGLYGETWAAGMTVKGVQTSLADMKATTFATDLGGSLVYPKEVFGTGTLRAAAAIRNLGPGMRFIERRDPLPRQWRLGVSALELIGRRLNLSLDYGQERDLKPAVYAGGEFWIGRTVALRAGYAGASTEGNGLRAGVGLKLRSVSFDYALTSMGDLGLAHRYELTVRFGSIRPRLTPEERAMLRRARLAMADERYGEAVELFDALIDLEPNYGMFRGLAKDALRKYEQQEQVAKNPAKMYPTDLVGRAKLKDHNPEELGELENLLKLGDSDPKVAAGKSAGGAKQ